MDLIRIFSELTFARVESSILREGVRDAAGNIHWEYDLEAFVNCGRRYYPEVSDDRFKTIFQLFKDTWQHTDGQENIFNVVRHMAENMLTIDRGIPAVSHLNLLRWNEITQIIGSELPVCAWLAHRNLHHDDRFTPAMTWPQVLNCDNPELNYLYQTLGLAELHSHLKASTNVFEISWLCLMNHLPGRRKQFAEVVKAHGNIHLDPMRDYLTALRSRLCLFDVLFTGVQADKTQRRFAGTVEKGMDFGDYGRLDGELQMLRQMASGTPYDYIPFPASSTVHPMDVFAGERLLLYKALRHIFIFNDPLITTWLYEYVLSKNRIRQMMIQVNSNMGFGNFARFERIKEIFISDRRHSRYSDLLKSQPVFTADRLHFVRHMETRITPKETATEMAATLAHTCRLIEKPYAYQSPRPGDEAAGPDYALICHFIKQNRQGNEKAVGGVMEHERDFLLREKVRRQALALKEVRHKFPRLVGIDAAASELDSRPEVFAQGFRLLRDEGLRFTYHAGEDFHDIADGLRTIDEAVLYLGMCSGDRIGHGTALALDRRRFYESCHNAIALPTQTLLDNTAWLLARSYGLGLRLDDVTRHNLTETFTRLFKSVYTAADQPVPRPCDYYKSMCLRGDNPHAFDYRQVKPRHPLDMIDPWKRCDLLPGEDAGACRGEADAIELYWRYHFDKEVRSNGAKVVPFKITPGYVDLIGGMQRAMMDFLGRKRIAIECCPTSNLKISRLGRYENHPVFSIVSHNESGLNRPAATVNTDDLGIFCTSLDNEFNLLAAAMLKRKDAHGKAAFTPDEVTATIGSLIANGWKYTFHP